MINSQTFLFILNHTIDTAMLKKLVVNEINNRSMKILKLGDDIDTDEIILAHCDINPDLER